MQVIDHNELFIGGELVAPAKSERIDVRSASTEEPIGSVPLAAEADVDRAVAAARGALRSWASRKAEARADVLEAFAAALEARGAATAEAVSAQNGMPVRLSQMVEATTPGGTLRYYAALLRSDRGGREEHRPGMFGTSSIVRRLPIGVVAAIVPWNYPETLAFTKIAPALAAGCTVVWKPSPETVLDAYVAVEAAIEAGLPPGVLNLVPGGGPTGAALVAHPGVDKIAFTGSTPTGRVIGETCGRLLRPVSLELGGKSAAIVLGDANLAEHWGEFFAACLANNGQTCYIGTRVLLPAARAAELTEQIADFVAGLTVGDALSETTDVGPLVSAHQRDRVESFISQGLSEGARLVTGGGRPKGLDRGFFVEPTVFDQVDNASVIAQEEIFGPVLTLTSYRDEAEAVRLANASRYGLGGSVWTSDIEHGIALAREIETGTIGVNGYLPDPGAPFGGVKDSGYGRENGPEALEAFLATQSIYLPTS